MSRFRVLAAAAAMTGATMTVATPAQAQADSPYIGQLMLFGSNYCPKPYWAEAAGQLLSVNQNQALFSLLGTIYGGDGRTTFGLPDLRGRVAIGMGQGPGQPNYNWGQKSGSSTTTLTLLNLPSHSHSAVLKASGSPPTTDNPAGASLADYPTGINIYATDTPNVVMNPQAIQVGLTGGNQPFNNMQPYLAMTYCIALTGVFPPRN